MLLFASNNNTLTTTDILSLVDINLTTNAINSDNLGKQCVI